MLGCNIQTPHCCNTLSMCVVCFMRMILCSPEDLEKFRLEMLKRQSAGDLEITEEEPGRPAVNDLGSVESTSAPNDGATASSNAKPGQQVPELD
jgi:hypothetical protein